MLSVRRHLDSALGGLPGVFWTLWWGLLVNRLATFVAAFLPLYLVRARGFGAAEAGRVVALFGLGLTIAAPVGGVLADRLGRRVTMVFALLAAAASVSALAVATSPVALAGLTFLAGATGDLFRPAMAASVADIVPAEQRPRAFGLVYWAINIGLSIGLLLAALVAERSVVALFFADAVTSAAFALIVLWRVPETRPADLPHEPALRGLARAFGDRHFVVFLLLQLTGMVVFCQWQLGLPLDMAAHGLGPNAFAILMAANCAGVVVLQPLLGPRLRRHDGARLLAVMALLFGAGFGLNALGSSPLVYGAGAVLWTVGEVVGFPVASALVAELAPPALRGRYQGGFSMMAGLSFMLGPLFGGEMTGRFGARTLWIACLALGLAVALGHLLAGGPRRRHLVRMRQEAAAPPAEAA